MSFVLGMVAGALIATTVWVAFMAPKHWEWYHTIVNLEAALRNAAEERDHYKHMSMPTQWGPVEQHEAGIKPKPPRFEFTGDGEVEFKFDDIREGGDV